MPDRLTLAEKAALTAGRDLWSTQPVERLGIPSIVLTDGPHGVRLQRSTAALELGDAIPATCFPTAPALAATWDVDLVEEVGVALGEEARSLGVSVLLGPGANIKRTPLCGRNFEYFSEDPFLSSAMAAAWVRGVQSTGVAASLKHFAANNQEQRRYSIDVLVDERALREIYLASFEHAVRTARPRTVMASYNKLAGTYAVENPELLTTILREEWGFDGLVVSDWGAVFDRSASIPAGCDLQMPGFGGQGDSELADAVDSGRIDRQALETAVDRILALVTATAPAREPGHTSDADAHHALARRVAAAGTVLLKNDGPLLPLPTAGRVAVIGDFAQTPRYQGAGSSLMNPPRLDDALTAVRELVGEERVTYAPGYRRQPSLQDPQLRAEAAVVARDADVVLVFVGLPESYETEGIDRANLRLPASHDALVRAVAAVNPNVVVVLSNGAPVELPWVDAVPAVVESYLGGQAGGSATADVLFGVVEPGGRLAETFPVRYADHPVSRMPDGPRQVEYWESVYVGYRWFDSAGADVRFPFGHGLGYTTFGHTDLTVMPAQVTDADDLTVTVDVAVSNTGNRSGTEVVQVYVHDVDSAVFRPEQELKGFAKVRLEPGETRHVQVTLDRRAFAFWDCTRHGWTVEPGRFEVRVGASSRDIRQVTEIEVLAAPGAAAPVEPRAEPAAYRSPDPVRGFDRTSFAVLYGRPLPENRPQPRGRYGPDTPLADMRDSWLARRLLQVVRMGARRVVRDGPLAQLVDSMVAQMPLRMLPLVTQGRVSPRAVRGLLDAVNGRGLRGRRSSAQSTEEARR